MHVFDARAEGFHKLQRIAAAEPRIAGVEVDADGFLMTERVEDATHAVHGVGENAVGFYQQLDAQGLRPADRFVEFLADAEQALIVAEMVAEFRLRVALGGDDLVDAEEVGELDRLDDLRRAVTVGRGGIQQIGVGADAGERELELVDHVENRGRMGIEAERGGKSVFGAEGGAVVIVCEVRVVEAEFADEFELAPHGREGLNEGETADFHGYGGWIQGLVEAEIGKKSGERHALGVLLGGGRRLTPMVVVRAAQHQHPQLGFLRCGETKKPGENHQDEWAAHGTWVHKSARFSQNLAEICMKTRTCGIKKTAKIQPW